MIERSKYYKKVVLQGGIYDAIHKILECYPNVEVAGSLLGDCREGTAHARRIALGREDWWRTNSFALVIPPSQRKELVGIFHVHRHGELSPSLWDLHGMIATPCPWLILGNRNKGIALRGFVYEENVVRRVPIVHTTGNHWQVEEAVSAQPNPASHGHRSSYIKVR